MTIKELKDSIVAAIKMKLKDPSLNCSDLAYLSEALLNIEKGGYENEPVLEPIQINEDPIFLSGSEIVEQIKRINNNREKRGLPPV